jgi:hypothetical protein
VLCADIAQQETETNINPQEASLLVNEMPDKIRKLLRGSEQTLPGSENEKDHRSSAS